MLHYYIYLFKYYYYFYIFNRIECRLYNQVKITYVFFSTYVNLYSVTYNMASQ